MPVQVLVGAPMDGAELFPDAPLVLDSSSALGPGVRPYTFYLRDQGVPLMSQGLTTVLYKSFLGEKAYKHMQETPYQRTMREIPELHQVCKDARIYPSTAGWYLSGLPKDGTLLLSAEELPATFWELLFNPENADKDLIIVGDPFRSLDFSVGVKVLLDQKSILKVPQELRANVANCLPERYIEWVATGMEVWSGSVEEFLERGPGTVVVFSYEQMDLMPEETVSRPLFRKDDFVQIMEALEIRESQGTSCALVQRILAQAKSPVIQDEPSLSMLDESIRSFYPKTYIDMPVRDFIALAPKRRNPASPTQRGRGTIVHALHGYHQRVWYNPMYSWSPAHVYRTCMSALCEVATSPHAV